MKNKTGKRQKTDSEIITHLKYKNMKFENKILFQENKIRKLERKIMDLEDEIITLKKQNVIFEVRGLFERES